MNEDYYHDWFNKYLREGFRKFSEEYPTEDSFKYFACLLASSLEAMCFIGQHNDKDTLKKDTCSAIDDFYKFQSKII